MLAFAEKELCKLCQRSDALDFLQESCKLPFFELTAGYFFLLVLLRFVRGMNLPYVAYYPLWGFMRFVFLGYLEYLSGKEDSFHA